MSHHYSGPAWGFPRGDSRLDLTDLYAFCKSREKAKSVLLMNVHPSVGENPPGDTTEEAFAPEALYELKIDLDDDAVADIAYRVRFSSSKDSPQTATLRRVEGAEAAATSDGGQVIVNRAPVSMGRKALVTEAGDYRFFAGWRSDPFFFDRHGALNNLQFTGDDFFADKNVCSVVLEVPNSELGPKKVGMWQPTPVQSDGGVWIQVVRGHGPTTFPGFSLCKTTTRTFASFHSRECDSKGAPRQRRLEHSRHGESSSGVCDRFTMEERIGVHQRTKRNHCFLLSQVGQGV